MIHGRKWKYITRCTVHASSLLQICSYCFKWFSQRLHAKIVVFYKDEKLSSKLYHWESVVISSQYLSEAMQWFEQCLIYFWTTTSKQINISNKRYWDNQHLLSSACNKAQWNILHFSQIHVIHVHPFNIKEEQWHKHPFNNNLKLMPLKVRSALGLIQVLQKDL